MKTYFLSKKGFALTDAQALLYGTVLTELKRVEYVNL